MSGKGQGGRRPQSSKPSNDGGGHKGQPNQNQGYKSTDTPKSSSHGNSQETRNVQRMQAPRSGGHTGGYGPSSDSGNGPRSGGASVPRSGGASVPRSGGAYVPRSGGGYVDMKGKLQTSTLLPPHLKQIQATAKHPWKAFSDDQGKIQIPVRVGEAKERQRTICLRVNHFPVQIKLPANIYHYVVDVSKVIDDTKPKKRQPQKPQGDAEEQKKALPRYIRCEIHSKLIQLLYDAFAVTNPGRKIGIISDRSNALYATQKLEDTVRMEQNIVIVPDHGRQETFRVILSPTLERIDTQGLQKCIDNMKDNPVTLDMERLDRVYNTLLKNLSTNRYVPIGRSSLICFEENSGSPLGGGLMNFKGYSATIEITNGWKPFTNIHIANCATILNKNVIDVFADLFKMGRNDCRTIDGWTSQDFKLASDLLARCKVKYHPLGNETKVLCGTVTKVISESVSQKKFVLESDGKKRQVSIYNYFVEKYGRTDLHRNGPCLELNGKNYVPAELCEVKKGQSINRKLPSDQTTAMLNCSKKRPDVLQKEIEQSISNLNLPNDTTLMQFGVSIPNKVTMHEIPEARILAPPSLCYSGAIVTPSNGVWDSFALKAKFLEGQKIHKWGILYTCKGFRGKDLHGSQRKFVEKLKEKGKDVDVHFTVEPITTDLSRELSDREDAAPRNISKLTNIFENHFKGCQIVIVVIPAKICHMYGHVKQAAELKVGLLTQCIIADNFDPQPNRADSIAGNIILKINSKLGGINHTVVNPPTTIPFKIFEEPVMIVGADVTHGVGDGASSYAAVTCTINRSGMPYMMHVQAQEKAGKGAAEVVENFDLIMKKFLIAYRNSTRTSEDPTGLIPQKIIYYRDGVGDGQFREVLHKEMRNIRKACTSLRASYQPAITFITVQKRHKTRFFMQKDGRPSEENAPPGTVVDTAIVHPTENDFFLLSHQGIKGSTVRPTRYHVLWDDSDFTADQIQQLTYYMCYMYVRCNRSVSIPAPTYYAHHAAKRASVLAHGLQGSIQDINQQLLRSALNEKSPMHFV